MLLPVCGFVCMFVCYDSGGGSGWCSRVSASWPAPTQTC